jgi:hypothetical protein
MLALRTGFARVVSVGLKMMYTGTKMNESGLFYGLVTPEHQTLAGLTPAQMATYRNCVIKRVADGGTLELVDFGKREEDTAYPTQESIEGDFYPPYPFSVQRLATTYSAGTNTWNVNKDMGAPTMAIAITGIPGATFYYEYIMHYEATGSSLNGRETVSHADSAGFEMTTMAARNLSAMQAALPKQRPATLMMDSLRKVAKAVAPVAVKSMAGTDMGAIAAAAMALL